MVATKNDKTPKGKVSPTVKINFSPVRKNKWANHVDVHQTLCMHVLVVLATRFDRPEGSFLHWMKMAFLDASDTLGVLWKITGFFLRRDRRDGADANAAQPKTDGSTFYWDVMVVLKGEADTPSSVGIHVAKEFTTFTQTSNQFQNKVRICVLSFKYYCGDSVWLVQGRS